MSIQSIGNSTAILGTGLSITNDSQGTTRTSSPSQTAAAGAAAQSAQGQTSPQQVQDAVKNMNDFVRGINSSLNFSVDKDSGETVVKVVDLDTKEVIKQIPSEEMLSIAKALDKLKGLL